MSERYKPRADWFAAQGEKYLGTPYAAMDCQAFVEQMLKDVGIFMDWRGSNAMWRDMAWTGTPEEAKEKFGGTPTGAFLFILKADGGEEKRGYHDGLGNASHVGVCTNKGKGAIHSSSSKGRVAESKYQGKTIPGGGWNRVGLCKLLDYGLDETTSSGAAAPASPAGEDKKENGVSGMIELYVTIDGNLDSGTVNVRKKPSIKGDLVGRVAAGEKVLGELYNDEWSKIRTSGGLTGYMMNRYLTLPEDVGMDLQTVEAPAVEDLVTIQVPRSVAQAILQALERSCP